MTRHLDAHRLKVAVTRLAVDNKVVDGTPKSRASARSIALDPATVLALRAHRLRQSEERLAADRGGWTAAWCSSTPTAGRPTPTVSTGCSTWPPVRRGSLPSAFTTLDIPMPRPGWRRGCDLKVMQERLGHSTIATTADLYVHVPSCGNWPGSATGASWPPSSTTRWGGRPVDRTRRRRTPGRAICPAPLRSGRA